MKDISSLQIGKTGEDRAVEYLKKSGYKIRARNFRVKTGEIDIVAERNKTIVFVEVKTMTDTSSLHEKLHLKKQRKLIRTAQWYLAKYGLEDRPWQIDVIAILQQLPPTHIERATADV